MPNFVIFVFYFRHMVNNKINEELTNLVGLLRLEKEEDLKQYKLRVEGTSLSERRKNGVCWYPVKIEKSSFSTAEQLIVKVSRPPEQSGAHLFQSGKMVNFFSNDSPDSNGPESVPGVVNSVSRHEMIITLNVDYQPDWLNDGKLGIQLLFDEIVYHEMEKGLYKLINKPSKRIDELKQILLGDGEARHENRETLCAPELNSNQNIALSTVLSARDVAIIHGPPGTGKTTTLVQAIIYSLRKETQVLVCAPSNAAVDLIAEKLGEQNVDVVRVGHPARINEEIIIKTLDVKVTKHRQYHEMKELRKSAHEYLQMAQQYKGNNSPEDLAQRGNLFTQAKNCRLEAKLLATEIRRDILNSTRVIATTLLGTANPALQTMHFSTVFIDEAAQGLEPASWLPILKSDRVVFAGDHCQLPPTIQSYRAAREGLALTLFEKAIQRNRADIMLTEQYRMNKSIMEFPNRHFYKNELTANSKVSDWTVFPNDAPVEFIDTAGCGFFEQVNNKSKSARNHKEMKLLFKHLSMYFDSIEIPYYIDDIENIGIISPYKAQVSMMQETFGQTKMFSEDIAQKIAVNTIDSFQGQERDIIYISLVRSNKKGEIGFLKDTRRMNVAMTRARKKLVVIGDSSTIGKHPFYRKFLDYIDEIGACKSASDYL